MSFIQSSNTQTAPAEYWRREVAAITENARKILLQVAEARRIARANGIPALVNATAPGSAVIGTTMPKEQAEAWLIMVDAVHAFLETEVSPGLTMEDGLYAMWPVISEEAQL